VRKITMELLTGKKNYYLQHRVKKIANFSLTKNCCFFCNLIFSFGK